MNIKKIEKLLKDLNIDAKGTVKNNVYIISLKDSNVFETIFNKLDSSELLTMKEETLLLQEMGSLISYYNKDIQCTLKGDFDKDIYTLEIREY